MIARAGCLTAVIGLLHGCAPAPVAQPHFVGGAPYAANGVWYYPREDYDLDETGIAAITSSDPARLTTDGELFDQTALAGGHPTLQLPAIARVTNLENGLQVILRINDRGSADPRRLLEVTRRAAELLDMPRAGVARVRLQVLGNESHAAVDALPNAPQLAMTTAPRGGIETADLAPLAGARIGGRRSLAVQQAVQPLAVRMPAPPMRLPEAVSRTTPRPGQLMVRLDSFDELQYAAVQRAKMTGLGAFIVTVGHGRRRQFRVDVGPLPDVARADAVLQRALASGIPDARIVVD